jgi:hypothetical protein
MCRADMSTVPVKKRQFRRSLVKIARCPHCKFRRTFLTIRKSGNVGDFSPNATQYLSDLP